MPVIRAPHEPRSATIASATSSLASSAASLILPSCAASSADGYWYDQDEHEWLTLLRGSARLALQSPEQTIDLSVGDGLYLAPHRRHRVERTDPEPGTLWLALYWETSDEDGRPTPARLTRP